jgi:hypothetical protein
MAGWLDSGATVGTAMGDPPDARGVNCSRAASFISTAILQQGARSSAVAPSSPPFAQHACEGSEAQKSAARAGRVVDPKKALTAMAAATRRIGGILLNSCSCGNSNGYSTTRTPETMSMPQA